MHEPPSAESRKVRDSPPPPALLADDTWRTARTLARLIQRTLRFYIRCENKAAG